VAVVASGIEATITPVSEYVGSCASRKKDPCYPGMSQFRHHVEWRYEVFKATVHGRGWLWRHMISAFIRAHAAVKQHLY
jgi:hypothetical protein